MTRSRTLAVALFCLCAAPAAFAADPQGPAFGKNGYVANIVDAGGQADTDDYVASLVAGERLDVTVAAAKGSALSPSLTLVAPDGTVLVPPAASVVVKKGGRIVSLRKFPVPVTGRWAVRIAGAQGTQGAYSVSFAIASAPALKVRRAPIVGPVEVVRSFDGIEGARVDVSIDWKDPKAAVEFRGIVDPSGRAVAGATPVVKAKSISIRGLVLHGGDGTYALHLGSAASQASYNLSVRVTPVGRPSSKKPVVLSAAEPFLAETAPPLRGVAGMSLRLAGTGFNPAAAPSVVFGRSTVPSTVAADGLSLSVFVPDGLDGSTVDVAVIARDGQASVRPAYFHYVEAVHVSDLVNDSGAPVRMLGVEGGEVLDLRGTAFEAGQRVFFGSVEAEVSAVVGTTSMHVVVPPAATGAVQVEVRDAFARNFRSTFLVLYVAPPTIDAASAVAGPRLDATRVALGGGATVEVSGSDLDQVESVTIGGVDATVVSATSGRLNFMAPPGVAGPATIVVTNNLGQTATIEDAIRYVGYDPADGNAEPSDVTVDDRTALRGAVADFDGDGRDDVVVSSFDSPPGSRIEFTRVFFGGDDGLTDRTPTNFPAAGSDPAGADSWKAKAVAASDVDGDGTPDIVIAGTPVTGDPDGDFEARVFVNDGLGGFSLSADSPRVTTSEVDCTDLFTGVDVSLYTPGGTNGATATALAIGDLDGDGRSEVVMVTDRYRTATVHLPLEYVSWYGDSAVMYDAEYYWNETGTQFNAPALRIFENRIADGRGLTDVTFPRVPLGGESGFYSGMPAFHGRDVKLGDVDGDGALDIVVTWDDPTTVTADGLGAGGDIARVATRVLINDGSGRFKDGTDSWMPAGSGAEYWQANRVVLSDLDGDGDLDMVLVAKGGLDAWQGAASHGTSALRILRNDGPGVGFVDVTSRALAAMPVAGTADDDLRGDALAVADFDGDSRVDIFVATTEALSDASGGRIRSTRLLRGTGDLTFAPANEFLPAYAADSGEADDLLLGAAAGSGTPSIVLVTETPPSQSKRGENLRTFTWQQ